MTSTTLPRSEIAGCAAIDVGKGRPVVLLHGVGLQADAWGPQIGALGGTHHLIAPDMPGHGQSPCPAAAMTVADYAATVLPVLEGLSEPALVVGHSMGAMIALELVARWPEKVCAVAALNAIFERSPKAAAEVQARAGHLDGLTVPDPTPTLMRWFGAASSPERRACETWLRAADPKGYKLAYTAFAHADGPSRQALEMLACPALFATGALEPNSTPEMSRKMADLAMQGQALIVDGAAHMMPMTHSDRVNDALMDLAQQVWP